MVAIGKSHSSHDLYGAAHRYRSHVLAAAAFVVALVAAVRLRPVVLFDDAAITARYATRIVDGQGWTYNPGDRTNGASAPLFTMLVSALHALGVDVLAAIRIVTTLAYAASIALVTYLGTRISGLIAGAFAGTFLLLWLDFATQGLSGMESSLAAALGLCVLAALLHRNDTWTGVFLGLALLNKLDAGMLAVAVTAAYLLFYRRLPWRIAAISTAILGPWLLFSTIYFGSPLPNSFTQKVSGEVANPALSFDRAWIVDSFRVQRAVGVVLLAMIAAAAVPYVLHRNRPASAALTASLVWPLLHLVVFSVMDLGDKYPWYLTVLYPPIALAAACTLGTIFQLARQRSMQMAIVSLAAVLVLAPFAMGLRRNDIGMVNDVPTAMATTPVTNDYLQFELARRTAGARVAELAEPTDVIATCFGWIAFEAIDHPIYELCPLNTRKETAAPRWHVTATFPGNDLQPLDPDWEVVETVYADNEIGGRVDIIRIG